MQYLRVDNVHKVFSHKVVFDGISFSISAGQKVALIAANGAGKTTLFRCLTGLESYPEGTVEWHDKISVGFLSQDTVLDESSSVSDLLFQSTNPRARLIREYELLVADPDMDHDEYDRLVAQIDEIDAWSYESRVRTIIAQLGLHNHLEKKAGVLSGGEAKRVALAQVLIEEPDFLLLDEPTNHLDVVMIEWLEDYIRRQEFTVLMVTHDRYFLENVSDIIYELEAGSMYRYPGSYSFYLYQKAQRDAAEAKNLHDMRQLYRKELEWMRTAPRARGSKSVYRSKNFYELETEYKTTRKKFHQKSKGLELSMKQSRLGGKILIAQSLSKSYGTQTIVNDFSYDFKQGERIGIVGPNGIGKSTFIRLLQEKEPLDSGHLSVGKTVVFGHYTQQHLDFDPSKKVLEVVRDVAEFITIADGTKLSATRLLERFMFPPKQQHSFVRFLSGGEKRRLSLLLVLLRNPNFLILDEPTNDLDVQTIQVLEQFLLSYSGCLLVISHDRFFLDKVVDHLFVFEGEGQISDFWGTYTEYKNSSDDSDSVVSGPKHEKKLIEEVDESMLKVEKLGYIEQREFDRLGEEIEELEEKKRQINLRFQDPDLSVADSRVLGKEMRLLLLALEAKESRRLELLGKTA